MMNATEARNYVDLYAQKRIETNLKAMEALIYDIANIGHTNCIYKIDFGTADEETCEKIRDSLILEAEDNGYEVFKDGEIGHESGDNISIFWD